MYPGQGKYPAVPVMHSVIFLYRTRGAGSFNGAMAAGEAAAATPVVLEVRWAAWGSYPALLHRTPRNQWRLGRLG